MSTNESPDPEINLHPARSSLPAFAGLALPSPLRELRRQHVAADSPHPSELTALAHRLNRIRLDTSPGSPDAHSPRPVAKPLRLNFDDPHNPAQDKENLAVRVVETGKPPRTPKRLPKDAALRTARRDTPDRSAQFSTHIPPEQPVTPAAGVADPSAGEAAQPDVHPLHDQSPAVANAGPTHLVKETLHADADAPTDTSAQPFEPQLISQPGCVGVPGDDDGPAPHIPTGDLQHASMIDSPSESRSESTQQVTQKADDDPHSTEIECANVNPAHVDQPQQQQSQSLAVQDSVDMQDVGETVRPPVGMSDVGQLQTEVVVRPSQLSNDDLSTGDDKPDLSEDVGSIPSTTETTPVSTRKSDFVVEVNQSGMAQTAHKTCTNAIELEASEAAVDDTVFAEQFQVILEGRDKWSWPKRCEAMSTVSQTLNSSPPEGIIAVVRAGITPLATAVSDNLDELRPSIITSALSLVSSVLSSKADEGSSFAEEVFPSVMDLSCGRSLTAQEASRCLSFILEFHPDLSNILEDADNPDRLIELLQVDVDEENGGPDSRNRARKALGIVRKVLNIPGSDGALSQEQKLQKMARSVSPKAIETPNSKSKLSHVRSSIAAVPEVADTQRMAQNLPSPGRALSSTGTPIHLVEGRTSRHHRFSERIGPVSSNSIKGNLRQSLRSNLSDIRVSTPLVRNKKLGDSVRKLGESVRKISPTSARKRRMFTEEDMEEARSAAIRVVMEETSQRETKTRNQHQEERETLEKSLRKEKAEVAELKSVLEEYELTMQKMVAQGNSQASAYCASLEKETKKLKAELVEVTEAYESVRERYDGAKQAIKVYENKETRFIEQIRGLKKNMAELQKWSDELKANCEKKLTKAFTQVTTYRASYMEAEAHRNKATTDLDRARSDLAKEVSNHTETAAALSRLEVSLHEEQDARSSLEASLSSAKDTLAHLTSQKERLQKEVSASQAEIRRTTAKLSELEDAETRATNASKQLETFTAERQSLKARAYDDMTRIRALETDLGVKDKEYQELNALCEEALSQLEKMKLQGK